MATATTSVATFLGQSGKLYNISFYTADTSGYVNTANPMGIATSNSSAYWRPPENCSLIDYSIATGTTQTTAYWTQDSATKAGSVTSYVACLNTLASRQKFNLAFPAGSLIGLITI